MRNKSVEVAPKGFDDYDVRLGDLLRGERATLGKTLEDVQEQLKIKAVFIDAIENCDTTAFTSQGFIAGYVRSYAQYLGLNAEDVYEQFCVESGFVGASAGVTQKRGQTATVSSMKHVGGFGGSIPHVPSGRGFLENVSLSAIGSVAMLGVLIAGLGYGGWTVLQEVQRVQLAPIGSAPELSPEISSVLPSETTTEVGNVATTDLNTVSMASLEQLYRPQELDVPRLIARDGPISILDPSQVGTLIAPVALETAEVIDVAEVLPVVTETGPAPIDIVATQAAWVRVYTADKAVLFEQVLNAGDRYRLPANVAGPLLRSGNAGSVYVMVGDKTFGPVGKGVGIAKNIDLSETVITERFAQVEGIFDAPLADPINMEALAQLNP